MRLNLSKYLLGRICVAAATLALAAVAQAQYLMIADAAGTATQPVTGTPHVMLFSAADGSLVDEQFIPQATSPYLLGFPSQALQVGNEIWVCDIASGGHAQIVCFTAVFNNSDPNPANWTRPTYLRTIGGVGGGLNGIRSMCVIGNRVYVVNTGTADGAPGKAVVIFQTDGTLVSSFPVAAVGNPIGIDNLNGQLLIMDFTGGFGTNNYLLYSTDGTGGVWRSNSSSDGPQQVVVLPTGSAGATEVWVTEIANVFSGGVRRYNASGTQLAFYPVNYGCKGVYVLTSGEVLYTGSRCNQVGYTNGFGSVKKFSPGTPPATPIVREVQTITFSGSGTYTLTYDGQTTGSVNTGTSPQTVLNALPNVLGPNMGVSAGASPVTVTFAADLPRVLMTATPSAGVTINVAVTTPGAGTITAMHDPGSTAGTGSIPNMISPFSPTAPVTTNPYASGFAAASTNQAAVLAGTSTTLTVNATLGTVPSSTGLVATADLSAFGGSSTQTLTPASGASNNASFTYTLSVPASQAGGNYAVPLTVTDAQSRTGYGTLSMTVIAAAPAGAFSETEANNDKTHANAVSLTPGKVIWGTTTGSASSGLIGSADYFNVTTAAAPLGIYVHNIYLTSSGTAGHVGTIRGLNQTSSGSGGVIGTTDTLVQTSGLATFQPRMVQWYGFGKQEHVYYRVEGTSSTTAEYLATYQTSPVTPTVGPDVLTPGAITFSALPVTNNAKFAMCLYDSNLNAISSSPYMSSTTGGGSATRTLAAGVYYLALSDETVANDQSAPTDSAVQTNPVLDFANAVVNSKTASPSATPTNLSLQIAHGGGTSVLFATKTQAYQVLWYKLYVGNTTTPAVDGVADTTPVIAGNFTQLTATVNPAISPASTGLVVRANLAALGGSSSQQLNGGGPYTFSFMVPTGQAPGLYTIPISVSDDQSRSGTGSIYLRVLPMVPSGYTLESEPNDPATSANSVALFADGQGVYGYTLGAGGYGAGSDSSPDNYVLSMPSAAQAIYRHRMTITTSGLVGHTGELRGRNQVNGSVDPFSDVSFQASLGTSTPARFNQWYGFGRSEQMNYRVDGTELTTSEYLSTLSTVTVTPIAVSGTVAAGSVTIARDAGNSSVVDMWLYDSTLHPIVDAGNEGNNALTRTLTAGTYYLAVSDINTASDLASPSDSSARSSPVLAYADAIANSSATGGLNMNMKFTHSGGTATATGTKGGPFDIVWYQFTVTANVTCCRGTTCLTVPAASCTGVVAGSHATIVSACGPNNHIATCCYADFDHSGSSTIDDIFIYLNAWFSNSPYAKVGGNGTATPTIDDIFLFLNNWFAGCS